MTAFFDSSCQGTLPVALAAFFESAEFEDAIRNAVSVGGDTDTIAAITGSIAAAYYGIPDEIREKALQFFDAELKEDMTDQQLPLRGCFFCERSENFCKTTANILTKSKNML